MQIQFLPFHNSFITWTQRVALLTDLGLVWWLWRKILSGREVDGRRPRGRLGAGRRLGLALSVGAVLFSWTVGDLSRRVAGGHLPSWRILPAIEWDQPKSKATRGRCSGSSRECAQVSLHDWVFNVPFDPITRRRWLPFSSTLVLPGLNIYEGLKHRRSREGQVAGFCLSRARPRSEGRDPRSRQSAESRLRRAPSFRARRSVARSFRARRSMARSFRARRSIARSFRVRRSITPSFRARRSMARTFRARRSMVRSFRARRSIARSFRARRSMTRSFRARRSMARSFRARRSIARSFRARRSMTRSFRARRSMTRSFRARRSMARSFRARRSTRAASGRVAARSETAGDRSFKGASLAHPWCSALEGRRRKTCGRQTWRISFRPMAAGLEQQLRGSTMDRKGLSGAAEVD